MKEKDRRDGSKTYPRNKSLVTALWLYRLILDEADLDRR